MMARFLLGWQLQGIWVGVGAGGLNAAERACVVDELRLERMGGEGRWRQCLSFACRQATNVQVSTSENISSP